MIFRRNMPCHQAGRQFSFIEHLCFTLLQWNQSSFTPVYKISFLILGTGHIVPTTFRGRLLAIITALVGIPLYALFLKHFGECILYINKRMIGLCESFELICKKGTNKNTKIVLVSFLEMMLMIFLGALGAFPFNWPYFDGKLDTSLYTNAYIHTVYIRYV